MSRHTFTGFSRWQIIGAAFVVALIGFLSIHSYNAGAGLVWNVIHAKIYLTQPCIVRPGLADFSDVGTPDFFLWRFLRGECGAHFPYSGLLAAAVVTAAVALLWPQNEGKVAIQPPPPLLPTSSALTSESQSSLVGVRGWLLFFCVGLTIIGPLVAMGVTIRGYAQSIQFFPAIAGFENFVLTLVALSIGQIVASIAVGVMLWSRRPRAPEFAKWFLLGSIALACTAPFLIYLFVDMPAGSGPQVLDDALPDILRRAIPSLVWYWYLAIKEGAGHLRDLGRSLSPSVPARTWQALLPLASAQRALSAAA